MRSLPRLCLAALLLLAAGCSATTKARADRPPNLLVILADDLGIECLSVYGGLDHHTPNLDRLAAQGMVFDLCFSAPYCSPSRASLLTGRYPFDHGVREVIWDVNRHSDLYLSPDQPSFARQLKQAGYATAIAGKWQLAFLHQRNHVHDFGFDRYQCWQIFDDAGNKTRRFHEPHLIRDGEIVHDTIKDRYGPDVNARFLIEFMQQNAEDNTPFLAYYTCLLPHFPFVPTPDSEDQAYRPPTATHKGDPRYFPDMVAYLDTLVGRLMRSLDQMGIADNTVVVFLADNGTDQTREHRWGEAGRIVKGGKGTMTDRGTRVPLIVRWPGKVKPGTRCDDLIDFSDLLPTLCEIADAPLPDQSIHGRSFAPQLLGRPGNPRRWVHVQDKTSRYVRSKTHILTDAGEFRPVVALPDSPAKPIDGALTDLERTEKSLLQSAFDELDRLHAGRERADPATE
ncbi:MAG: sulfatase-like hydrolase/transferase [Phycisphaeraceae bacterium]